MPQLTLNLSLPQPYTRETFIASPSNGEALDWLSSWPHWPLRQVALYGEKGCGKSHLGRIFCQISGGRFVSGDETRELSPALLVPQANAFIIDDYESIDETWLFHFYNLTKEAEAFVLYTGVQSPGQHTFALADIRSRLRSIHAIAIHEPDETLFKGLLHQLLANRGLNCPDDILEYTFRRFDRSYQAIHTLVDQIDEATLSQQRRLTLPLLREILSLEGAV